MNTNYCFCLCFGNKIMERYLTSVLIETSTLALLVVVMSKSFYHDLRK